MKIEGKELTPESVGLAVHYIPAHAKGNAGHPDVQHGRIKTWNDDFVFCWYDKGDTAQATDSKDLRWGT